MLAPIVSVGLLCLLFWVSRSSQCFSTRAMLRRPGVSLVMLHEEGCFRLADRRKFPTSGGGLEQTRESCFHRRRLEISSGSSESLPPPRSCSGQRTRNEASWSEQPGQPPPFD